MGMKREAVQEERQRNKEKGEMDMDSGTGYTSIAQYHLQGFSFITLCHQAP